MLSPRFRLATSTALPDMVESAALRRAVGLPVPERLSRSIDAVQQQLDRLRRVKAQGRR